MVESADDLAYLLGWDNVEKKPNQQPELFVTLTDEEHKIYQILKENGECGMDDLMVKSRLPVSKIAASLLNLEFQGMVITLPGNRYKLK
jgi:DNA processing protein